MKIILRLSLIVFCLISVTGFAQKALESGSNVKKPNLDKFTGTWQWVKGDDTLTVFLKKENVSFITDIRSDVLLGFYTYKVGKKTIASSYSALSSSYSDQRYAILATTKKDPNVAYGTFKGEDNSRLYDIELKLDSQEKILSVKMLDREGLRVGNSHKESVIPKAIVLSKK